MKLNGRIRRMDSMMIESNIRFLSRMELIYTCISKLVIYLTKNSPDKVSFDRNHCAGCPYQDQCRPKIYKKIATFITSKNASNRAKSQRYMQSDEFSNLARLRNGVETIPANIRKNYHLDKLPRGKQRSKFFFGSKIAALNFRKLFGFRKGLGNYAPNPLLA